MGKVTSINDHKMGSEKEAKRKSLTDSDARQAGQGILKPNNPGKSELRKISEKAFTLIFFIADFVFPALLILLLDSPLWQVISMAIAGIFKLNLQVLLSPARSRAKFWKDNLVEVLFLVVLGCYFVLEKNKDTISARDKYMWLGWLVISCLVLMIGLTVFETLIIAIIRIFPTLSQQKD